METQHHGLCHALLDPGTVSTLVTFIILILNVNQVMREYTSKVDKLEEAENQRATEAVEEKNKPIVMGKFDLDNDDDYEYEEEAECSGVGVDVAAVVYNVKSQPDDT